MTGNNYLSNDENARKSKTTKTTKTTVARGNDPVIHEDGDLDDLDYALDDVG